MLSNGTVKYKRSSLERITNYFILFCVLLLVFMVVRWVSINSSDNGFVFSGGICSIIWLREYNVHKRSIPFVVTYTSSPITDGLLNMAAYILVYQVNFVD